MIGERLGAYTIRAELGAGGMGKVYLVENGQRAALKVLHPHLLESPEALERFRREAEIGRRVRHDNVVSTLDVGSADLDGVTHHYLVMEYVEGQTLRGLLAELGRVPEELCRHIGREMAEGLKAIHAAGVVHRDVKPDNVLITKDHVVKVMDLGVAKLLDAAIKLSQTGVFLGSVLYAAPEQFRGVSPDARTDFYSLGLVLYELATGKHPFQAEAFADIIRRQLDEEPRPAAELNPQLSPFFEEVCKALLEKDHEKRLAFLPAGEDSKWWKERARAVRRETNRPLRRIRIPRETALYGRDDDLARLTALYERAKAGEGRVLLLQGEAGIGKTRLVDEFVGRLQQAGEDLNFLFGSYPPGGAATAAGAFTTAYREQLGDDGAAAYLPQTPALVPAFDALLRGEPSEEPLTKESLQACFVRVTRSLAAERPTVVLVDDLHFAPDEGRALFMALALAVPGHRVLLVGTMRPGVEEEWIAGTTRLEQCEQVALARLGPKDLMRLLQDSFRSERLAGDLGTKIALKSDGNPFFAFEIIDGLREGRYLTQNPDGSWATTRAVEDIRIPSSVMDLIAARIADLAEEERDLLDVAACCGFEFDPGLVAAALGLGQIPALKRLGQIERKHRLVRSAGRHYVFDHHQVQEALYAGLHEQLREPYHAALGEALEARAKEKGGAVAVQLCEHFLKGALGERARPYLDHALDHLENKCHHEAAIRLAELALQVEGLLEGEQRVRVLQRKAGRHDLRGEGDLTRAAFEEALRVADACGDTALRAGTRVRLAWHLAIRTSDCDTAQQRITEALDLVPEVGDKRLEAEAAFALGHVLGQRSRIEEARAQFEKALTLAREADDRRGEIAATTMLATVLSDLGRFDARLTHLKNCLALAEESGDPELRVVVAGNLGRALADLAYYDEAITHFETSLALARAFGTRRSEAHVLASLGNGMQEMGRNDVARSLFEQSLAIARELGDRLMTVRALDRLAWLTQWEGNPKEALRLCEEYVDRLIGRDTWAAASIRAKTAAARGDAVRAAAHWDEAVELARKTGVPALLLQATVDRAMLPGGDKQAALAMFQEHGERLRHVQKTETRFRLWQLTKDRTHLEEAHRLLAFAREHAPADCRESIIENVPLHRDIMRAWAEHGRAH